MPLFGCIADDFTGASDVASFLMQGGLRTCLFNGIPSAAPPAEAQALVVSLKTRTMARESAVRQSLHGMAARAGLRAVLHQILLHVRFDARRQYRAGLRRCAGMGRREIYAALPRPAG